MVDEIMRLVATRRGVISERFIDRGDLSNQSGVHYYAASFNSFMFCVDSSCVCLLVISITHVSIYDIGNESAFKYELCDLNCFDDIVNLLINLTRC